MPISPEMLSPATLPVKAKVSGIGLVIETFQATSSPLAVPSKISVELPSAPCVPVSTPPAFLRLSVALRSPIGVLIVMFQFPSTAISLVSSRDNSQNRNGFEIWGGSGGGIAHLTRKPNPHRRELFGALDQAWAAARKRLVISMRNATYCTAKAATLAPIATTDT